MNDLEEIYKRLEYSDKKLNNLSIEAKAYMEESIECDWRPSLIQSPPSEDLYVSLKQIFPLELKAELGAVCHEIRACLDSLICQLALRNGKDPKNAYFPINKSKETFETNGKKKISKLSEKDQNIIAEIKPYGGGNDLLYNFHQADIRHKHFKLCAFSSGREGVVLGNGASHVPGNHSVLSLGCSYNGFNSGQMFIPSSKPLPEDSSCVLVVQNIPKGFPIDIYFHIRYLEPEELRGKICIDTLKLFLKHTKEIIDKFNLK